MRTDQDNRNAVDGDDVALLVTLGITIAVTGILGSALLGLMVRLFLYVSGVG